MRHLLAAALTTLTLSTSANAAYDWKSVQIHGGGYVPGIAFHPTAGGPVYARTDVGGAYRLATNRNDWIPLNDAATNGDDMGSIAIGLDPDDTNYVYLTGGLYLATAWGGGATFLTSSDRGATWNRTQLRASKNVTGVNLTRVKTGDSSLCLGGNENSRGVGPRIAAKGTTIYLGTNQNGLLKSTDRGATWATVTALGDTGVSAVIFDKDGNVYAAPYAGGIYKSTNGTAWTKLDGFTGKVFQMSYAKSTNTFWITSNSNSKPFDMSEPGGGSVWTFDATAKTFAQVATLPAKGGKDYGYGGISVNPSKNSEVLVATAGWWRGSESPLKPASFVPHEAIFLSRDGGTTWKDILAEGSFDAASAASSVTSNPHWITGLAVDPADSNHVIFGTGYGVWSTFDATAAKPTWIFDDKGIEETVPLALASSTVGAPLVSAVGDVDGYYHTNVDVAPTTRHQIEAGTNFDLSVAELAPNKMIRIFKEATKGLGAYSNDGGKTWTAFKTYPPFVASQWSTTYTNESNYAAISADGKSIVWNMQTNGAYYSTDSGATWKASGTSASLLSSSVTGMRVVADRATAGTFYIYNGLTGILYRSVNSGANWTAINSSLQYDDDWALGYFHAFASPKQAGEIWLTQAAHFYACSNCAWSASYAGGLWVGKGSGSSGLLRSTDGGKTTTAVSGMLMATYVAFGKGKTATVPAIYVKGVNSKGVSGLFRSTDDAATWTQIDDATHQYGGISMVTGDPCIYSRVYVSGGGARGALYGEEAGSKNTSCPDRSDYALATGIVGTSRISGSALRHVGNRIVATGNASIRLTDLRGHVLRTATGSLELSGLPQGIYLASDGSASLRIPLAH